jgi:hypothetical protein
MLRGTADEMQEIARQPKAPKVKWCRQGVEPKERNPPSRIMCDQQMKGVELLALVMLMSLWPGVSKQGTQN